MQYPYCKYMKGYHNYLRYTKWLLFLSKIGYEKGKVFSLGADPPRIKNLGTPSQGLNVSFERNN